MALLPILEFPDPRLRTVAAPVDLSQVASAQFQRLLDDMFETMYAAPGIGLAASQVDVHQRFMVIDVSEEKDQPRDGAQEAGQGQAQRGLSVAAATVESPHENRFRRNPRVRRAVPALGGPAQ